jgi:hypothetical protein
MPVDVVAGIKDISATLGVTVAGRHVAMKANETLLDVTEWRLSDRTNLPAMPIR